MVHIHASVNRHTPLLLNLCRDENGWSYSILLYGPRAGSLVCSFSSLNLWLSSRLMTGTNKIYSVKNRPCRRNTWADLYSHPHIDSIIVTIFQVNRAWSRPYWTPIRPIIFWRYTETPMHWHEPTKMSFF